MQFKHKCRPENATGGALRNSLISKGGKAARSKPGVGAFFRNREAALTHSHWQVLV